MNIWNVISIGIGSMVGAGIFALLGQIILLVGSNTFISFSFAGFVALLSGYSYAKLASKYPSSSGILEYYEKGFVSKILSGGFSLLYLFTLAASIAVVAKAFGSYLSGIIFHDTLKPNILLSNIFATLLIVAIFFLNAKVTKDVGKAESLLVGIKICILTLLIIAGLPYIRIMNIVAMDTKPNVDLISSIGLAFFAFAGFGMMTNASGEVKNPKQTIPKAIFLAIFFVIILYILLSLVVIGSVSQQELKKNIDIAIAIAAKPILGNTGFFIISIVALLATTSGVNAMMFSGMRITQGMAIKKQLPSIFLKKFFGNGTLGFLYSIISIIIIVNIFNLEDLTQLASITFLICYFAILIVSWILRKEISASRFILFIGILLVSLILVFFIYTLLKTSPILIAILFFFLLACFFIEYILIMYIK